MRRVLIPRDVAPAIRRPVSSAVEVLAGETMGTTWSVRWCAAAPVGREAVRGRIENALDRIVAQMSPWIEASDISAFNRASAGAWVRLPDDFREVLRGAQAVAEQTGGAYDPTMGELVNAWGFGPGGSVEHPPDDVSVAAMLGRSGFQRLRFDGERVRQPGGLRLDLSSIAKGFAVDRVARAMTALGLPDHLVEIGGELRGAGVKPDGSPWWVALETPSGLRPGRAADDVVALHGLSVATSGDSQRRLTRDGQTWSHTIDPRTGQPVSARLASVTVLHRRCMEADAWATGLLVLGPDEGPRLATGVGLAALFFERTEAGCREITTPAFDVMLS